MSIADKQVKRLSDKIIEKVIKDGKFPNFNILYRQIADALARFPIGKPTLVPEVQKIKQRFDIDAFNENVDKLVEDLDVVNEEQTDQIITLLRHFNAGEAEIVKADRELAKLNREINHLLLAQRNTTGYLYSVGDTFDDMALGDMSRTTTEVNLDDGSVYLTSGSKAIRRVDLTHLTNRNSSNFAIMAGQSSIIRKQLSPGTIFGDAFTDIARSWKETIFASVPVRMVGSFSIPISTNRQPRFINRIALHMSSRGPTTMSVQYRAGANADWAPIPTSRNVVIVQNNYTWIINTSELQSGITDLRFTFVKEAPDAIVNNEHMYEFGIKNIALFHILNDHEGEFHSKSLSIDTSVGDPVTINQLSIEVDQDTLPGTNIEYYVAPDRYVGAKVVKDDGSTVNLDHPDGNSIESDDNRQMLQSEIRDWFRKYDVLYPDGDVTELPLYTSTLIDHSLWEPEWYLIQPVNTRPSVNDQGDIGLSVIDFHNIQNETDSIIDSAWAPLASSVIFGGNSYYMIYNFPTTSYIRGSVHLWPGKSCWKQIQKTEYATMTQEASGVIQSPTEDAPFPSDALLTAVGDIVKGSITSVRAATDQSAGALLEPYTGTGRHPEYFTKISSNKLWIVRNDYLSTDDIPINQPITFQYKVRTPIAINQWTTNVFLDQGENVFINLPSVFSRATISNLNSETDFEVGFKELSADTGSTALHSIGQGHGWYNILITIPEDSTYIPTQSNPFGSGVLYYADRSPMGQVSDYTLLNDTHKFDHSFFSVYEDYNIVGNPIHGIRVNDITAPSGTVHYSSQVFTPNSYVTASELYASRDNIASFYDLQYDTIQSEVHNVLFKAVLRSDNENHTPALHQYTLRIGNELRTN